MKKIILSVIFLFVSFLCSPQLNSSKNITYLFNSLLDYDNEKDMIELCQRNGFVQLENDETYTNFADYKGNILSFRIDTIPSGRFVPSIEMTSKLNKKEIEKILTSLGYEKKGDRYQKGNPLTGQGQIKVCTIKQVKENGKKSYVLFCTKEFIK